MMDTKDIVGTNMDRIIKTISGTKSQVRAIMHKTTIIRKITIKIHSIRIKNTEVTRKRITDSRKIKHNK